MATFGSPVLVPFVRQSSEGCPKRAFVATSHIHTPSGHLSCTLILQEDSFRIPLALATCSCPGLEIRGSQPLLFVPVPVTCSVRATYFLDVRCFVCGGSRLCLRLGFSSGSLADNGLFIRQCCLSDGSVRAAGADAELDMRKLTSEPSTTPLISL